MKLFNKYIMLSAVLISLTACSERDVSMHTPGFDYLHKDLSEERETEVVETKGNVVSSRESYRKLMARYRSDISSEMSDVKTQNEIDSIIRTSRLTFPLREPVLLFSKYADRTPPHRGDDLTPMNGMGGMDVIASHSGKVVVKGGPPSSYGYYITLEGDVSGEKIRTVYAHLQKASKLNVGDTVNQGDLIGYMGSTGNSTGNHLHFEVQIYDPDRSKVKKTISPSKLLKLETANWFKPSAGPWVPTDPALYLADYEPNTPARTLVGPSTINTKTASKN